MTLVRIGGHMVMTLPCDACKEGDCQFCNGHWRHQILEARDSIIGRSAFWSGPCSCKHEPLSLRTEPDTRLKELKSTNRCP